MSAEPQEALDGVTSLQEGQIKEGRAPSSRDDSTEATGSVAGAGLPGIPPLHRAAAEDNAVALLSLLARGIDPDEEDAIMGEPALFEAVAADAVAAVALLLLFGADASRSGRHTSASAADFAPENSEAVKLLHMWQHGDRAAVVDNLVPFLELLPPGSPEARAVLARLEMAGSGCSERWRGEERRPAAPAAPSGAEGAAPAPGLGCGSEPPRAYLAAAGRPGSAAEAWLCAAPPPAAGDALYARSAVAHIAWALVAACDPRAVLSALPAACRATAAIVLLAHDDAAWQLATLQVAPDVVLRDRRRRGRDGRPQSWRNTFQELATQRLFCWGVDGTVTGLGARAPSKTYARPQAPRFGSPARPPAPARGAGRRRAPGFLAQQARHWLAPAGGAAAAEGLPRRRFAQLAVAQPPPHAPGGAVVAPGGAPAGGAPSPPAGGAPAAAAAAGDRRPSAREPRSQPLLFSIACGRRHSAVSTFGGAAWTWGRDVALPAAPPEEALSGLEAWSAWRATQHARCTACDRPRRLELEPGGEAAPGGAPRSAARLGRDAAAVRGGGEATADPAGHGEAEASVLGLSATPSATLLRLDDGRTVCAGGWAAHEAQLPERLAEASEALQGGSGLPPLKKVARGFCFNVALATDGRVFIWHHASMFPAGSAGRVPQDPYLALPAGQVAVDVATGEGHIVVLTRDGQVWTCGWQQRSAIGRGPRLSQSSAASAAPVPGLRGVVQIGAGSTYSLCVDDEGAVWMFGEGPCVTGAFNDNPAPVCEPRRVPCEAFGGRRVLSAACGDGHVVALTAWDPHRCLLQPGAWYAEGGRGAPGSLGEGDAPSELVL